MIPTKDTLLVDWGANFLAKVTPTPANYQLTAAQVTALQGLYNTYLAGYQAVAQARQNRSRSHPLTVAKDTARLNFLQSAREHYGQIQDSLTISAQLKSDAGIVVRKTSPTPVPPPADAPEIDILSVSGRTVRLRLHTSDSTKRARPAGTIGASVLSFVGESAPADVSAWKWEGNTSLTRTNISFPPSVPSGATVWFTAVWFNNRKQTSPMAQPKSANLPGGSVSMAA